MKNNKIFIIYVFLLILFVSILKNINCKCIDIPFLTNEMIYFYQFILHIFLILPKYGYFQEKITHDYLHYVIRCRSKVSLYHLLIKGCLQFVFVITMIKIIVEGIAFHYFNFYISLIYGFYLLFMMMSYLCFELFLSKETALICIGLYIAVSLSIGDLLYENHLNDFIYLFIPNLIYQSRNDQLILSIVLLSVLNLLIYSIGKKMISKKDLL